MLFPLLSKYKEAEIDMCLEGSSDFKEGMLKHASL